MLLRQQLLDLIWQEGFRLPLLPEDQERNRHQTVARGMDGISRCSLEKETAPRGSCAASLTSTEQMSRIVCRQADGHAHRSSLLGGGAIAARLAGHPLSKDCAGGGDGDVDADSERGVSSGEDKGMAGTEDALQRRLSERGGDRVLSQRSGSGLERERPLEGDKIFGYWSCTQGDAQVRKHLQVRQARVRAW